jgi:hypothetical protein
MLAITTQLIGLAVIMVALEATVPAIVLGGIAEELRTRGIRAPRVTRGTLRRSLGFSID